MAFVHSADHTNLFTQDWGSGRPIVLVHGWPLTSAMWDYQTIPLAEQGFRVITYDRRGFGHSGKPFTGYNYDTFADDLKAVLDHYDLQDVVLVGFSMGGGEVARYMSRHGGARIGKAVLVAAVTPFLLKTSDNPDGIDRSVFDGIVQGIRNDRPAFFAAFGKSFYGAGLLSSPVSGAFLDWTTQLAMQASPKATLDCVRAWSETDFRLDLTTFMVPTLVIHGDSDATVPVEKSGALAAKLVRGAELKIYKGAPHGLTYTDRDKLNADLAAFARA